MKKLLLILALLAPPAMGQAPPPAPDPAPVVNPLPKAVITGPSSVNPGDLVILRSDGSSGDGFAWARVDQDGGYLAVNGDTECVFAIGTPGSYTFVLFAVKGGPPVRVVSARFTVVVQSPTPPPTPTPTPPPTPTPTPPPTPPSTATYTGPLDATLIYDIDATQDPTTAVRVSTVKADLAAIGANWWAFDSRSAVAGPFLSQMGRDGIAVPVVYITDKGGKVWGKVVAPTSKDQVIAAVKAIRGGK